MSDLNEFAVNLPMIGVPPLEDHVASVPYDVTAEYALPPEVCADSADHVHVYVENCPQINQIQGSSMVSMDLVLNVNVSNPGTGTLSTYKIVKRLSMDKCKLAHQAEVLTPFQVVEATTPETEAKKLAEAQAAYRAKQLAGLI